MSLDIILSPVCQNLYSVFLFWSLGEMYVQIPAFLFPLACTTTNREQRGKRIKSQPDPSVCWEGGAHYTCVTFNRLMFQALLSNHQQLKCHQLPRHSVPKLHPLSSPRILFLLPAQRNYFILFCPSGWEEFNIFPHHHHPLPSYRPQCPCFQCSIVSCSLLPALLLLSHLPAPHGHRRSCLGGCCPTSEVPRLWWGPGCQPQWIFWAKSNWCSRTSSALFQWYTRCPGCALHASWAGLQLMAVTPEDPVATVAKCHQWSPSVKADGHTAENEPQGATAQPLPLRIAVQGLLQT